MIIRGCPYKCDTRRIAFYDYLRIFFVSIRLFVFRITSRYEECFCRIIHTRRCLFLFIFRFLRARRYENNANNFVSKNKDIKFIFLI